MQPRCLWKIGLLFLLSCSSDQEFTLRMVDVGYGTALLFQDQDQTILIDGGYREEAGLLEAELQHAGVESLALMIASHGHGDHLEGLTWLLDRGWAVGEVLGNVDHGHASYASSFWNALARRRLGYRRLRPGDLLSVGDLELFVFHPDTLTKNLNQSSLVVSIKMGRYSVLIPSDIDPATQRSLVRRYGDSLAADILVLPHHGDLLAPEFLEAVSPQWGLLSVGPNPWELPVPHTLTELKARVIRLLDTREDGTVVLSFEENGIRIVSRSGPVHGQRREKEMAERIRRWTHDR